MHSNALNSSVIKVKVWLLITESACLHITGLLSVEMELNTDLLHPSAQDALT